MVSRRSGHLFLGDVRRTIQQRIVKAPPVASSRTEAQCVKRAMLVELTGFGGKLS
jgi:hypothetical protein